MSSDLKTYKFIFKATIGEFMLNAPNISCPLIVTWKRSSQSVSSEPTQMAAGRANFNQTLSLPINMYYDQGAQSFQDKKTLFTFTMTTPKGEKQAGVVYIEVAKLLNNKLDKLEDTYVLEKCPVKDSKVSISIEAELLGEGAASDTMSIDSTMFNQGSGPSSLSTISIQSRRDTQKVTDSSIMMRKQEREDPEKDKKIERLQKQVRQMAIQKQKLLKQLQKSRSRDQNAQIGSLRQQLVKSKSIQQKLQHQINNLRSENIQHERQLQKMRKRMQQIYQLLLGNLNSLY